MNMTPNKNLLGNAKALRKELTPQERHLWYCYLKSYPTHFYRQRIIHHYIVDFYCPSAQLVIELDGSQHYTDDGQEYDTIRTEILEQYNLKVVRFSNSDIDENFDGVCQMIDLEIKGRIRKGRPLCR